MGRGVARQARDRYPSLPRWFALLLKQHGNVPIRLMTLGDGATLVSFPTKNEWRRASLLPIIKQSSMLLVEMTDRYGWQTVVLPRPGCGAGSLTWAGVKPIIEPLFDDRFVIVSPKSAVSK